MSTLPEIKAAAATLPAQGRSALVAWLSESEDVWKLRRENLRREIQIGLDEIERGDVEPLVMAEIKRKARAGLAGRTKGRVDFANHPALAAPSAIETQTASRSCAACAKNGDE